MSETGATLLTLLESFLSIGCVDDGGLGAGALSGEYKGIIMKSASLSTVLLFDSLACKIDSIRCVNILAR